MTNENAGTDGDERFADWWQLSPELREVVYAILRAKVADCDAKLAEWAVTRSPLREISMATVVQAFGDEPPPEPILEQMGSALDKVTNVETYARILERRGLYSAIAALGGGVHAEAIPWGHVATEVRFLVGIHLGEESLEQQRFNVRSSLQTIIAQRAFSEIAAVSAEMGNVGFASGFDAGAYTASMAALEGQLVVTAAISAASEFLDTVSEQTEEDDDDGEA